MKYAIRSKFWLKCAKYKIIWTFGFWSFSISIALHPCKQDLDVRYRNLAPQDEKYREILNENELCWICRCLLQRSLCWSHHGWHGKPFYTPDVSNPQQFVFSLLLSEIQIKNKQWNNYILMDRTETPELRLLDTDLRVVFRLVGEAFFKDWIVAVTHSSAIFEATCSWQEAR